MLGGLFNALIAPAVFHSLAEYPLVMVLAACSWPPAYDAIGRGATRLLDVILGLGAGMLALVLSSDTLYLRVDFTFLTRVLGLTAGGEMARYLEQALTSSWCTRHRSSSPSPGAADRSRSVSP